MLYLLCCIDENLACPQTRSKKTFYDHFTKLNYREEDEMKGISRSNELVCERYWKNKHKE
jgi:hypothetical protein